MLTLTGTFNLALFFSNTAIASLYDSLKIKMH